MSENIFLQEMRATVALFDVRRFGHLSTQFGPMDLGVALNRFYRHVEQAVLAHEGRIVKFISDAVLVLFPSIGDVDHATRGLKLVRQVGAQAPAWYEENVGLGLPSLEYSVGMATGTLLHGNLGTDRQHAFDVLGRPVNLAFKLAHLATVRGVPHLVDTQCVNAAREEIPCIEVEGAEIGGEKERLYRILSEEEQTR
jgi:adenylate cyclase